ncbi:hypothetical protein AYI69_g7261 [Smittium culicis]|uniref:Uncharacterized protein n=1 Tax=Smittium culicis TaxID=133412 RepID=A0A1R1XTC9_9FUNG|nr:hypothetical protein AYI69_g7261 [Smittium culicis]
MDSKKFDTKLAAIKPTKRARIRRLLCGLQKSEERTESFSFIPATAPIAEATATSPARIPPVGGFRRKPVMASAALLVKGRISDFRKAFEKLMDNQCVQKIMEKMFQIPFKKLEPNSKDFEENKKIIFEEQSRMDGPPLHKDFKFITMNPQRPQKEIISGPPPLTTQYQRYKGGRESNPRILKQFIPRPKEDWRATPSIESKDSEPAPRGKKFH